MCSYFFTRLLLKKFRSPKIVGGQSPMKIALLESFNTIKMYSLKNIITMQEARIRISIKVRFFMRFVLMVGVRAFTGSSEDTRLDSASIVG